MFGDVQRMEGVERARSTDRQKEENLFSQRTPSICFTKRTILNLLILSKEFKS
jgi:hypothetical protein